MHIKDCPNKDEKLHMEKLLCPSDFWRKSLCKQRLSCLKKVNAKALLVIDI